MKTLIAVSIKTQYFNNITGEIDSNLTDHQKLLSSLYTNTHTFQEIYTIQKRFEAKTAKQLNLMVEEYEIANNYPDFYVRTDLINKS